MHQPPFLLKLGVNGDRHKIVASIPDLVSDSEREKLARRERTTGSRAEALVPMGR